MTYSTPPNLPDLRPDLTEDDYLHAGYFLIAAFGAYAKSRPKDAFELATKSITRSVSAKDFQIGAAAYVLQVKAATYIPGEDNDASLTTEYPQKTRGYFLEAIRLLRKGIDTL